MATQMATRPSKKRRLSPPTDNQTPDADVQKAFFKNAKSWNLEQDFEKRPRKGKKKQKESTRLPVKTADGRVEQAQPNINDAASVESDGDWLDGEDDRNGDGSGDDADPEQDREPEPVHEGPKLSEREQILLAKEELAKIALLLNEDPEEHPGAFKALAKVGYSRLPSVKKLCLATQLAVYKDVIPGYRVRPASEDPAGQKLSKEVMKVRTYEHALVTGYQNYLKDLAKYAKLRGSQDLQKVAITCACTLVNAVPHFNFRTDLLKILVAKLSSRKVDESFNRCLRSFETLFRDDEEGRPSMEAVSLLSKMMKVKNYQVNEAVLNLFLWLRVLSEFAGKASKDGVDGPTTMSNTKKKKEFRTKRERKEQKEERALAKEMVQADATVSHEERDRMQSETLKLVFATYFRVLKARLPHLMGAVLEGLNKYAHLINQDFFGDLLEALKDLIRYSEMDARQEAAEEAEEDEVEDEDDETPVRNTTREALLCTVTAFALLAGQDAHNARGDLHLDLSFFSEHLFQSLLPLSVFPDLELTSVRSSGADTAQSAITKANKVNVHTMTVLVVRCLTAVLLPPWNVRSVPPLRLAAFSKQMMTIALQMPEKSCQAMLALLHDVVHTHGKKIAALWNSEERKDDGTFNPLSQSVEASNPFATTIWEGELLRKHYSPKVREGQKLLDKSLRSLLREL